MRAQETVQLERRRVVQKEVDRHPLACSAMEAEHQRLISEATTAFSPDDDAHVALLRDLWTVASLGTSDEFEPVNFAWLDLGFQGPDPLTDLRGAGLWGLKHLCHFMRTSHFRPPPGAAPCPIASASLNVTLLLCRHLRLQPPCGTASCPPCSDRVLRNTLRLTFANRSHGIDVLELMHASLLRIVIEGWYALERATPLHFPALLHSAASLLERALCRVVGPWNTASVLCALRAETLAAQQGWVDGGCGLANAVQLPWQLLGLPELCSGFASPRLPAWSLARLVCEMTRRYSA